MMNERKIQSALFKAFHSHPYKFTNAYYFNNESDWLSFLASGFCYEVEIKISRSDFKADFKKEKHVVHKSHESKGKTFLRKTYDQIDANPSWDFCRQFPELITSREYFINESVSIDNEWDLRQVAKIRYHMQLSSGIEFVPTEQKMLPNKFFYAVPVGLISKEEVPDYAGLLYVDELGRVTKIKDGKFLHKEKLDVKKLFSKTYYVYERELLNKLTLNNN